MLALLHRLSESAAARIVNRWRPSVLSGTRESGLARIDERNAPAPIGALTIDLVSTHSPLIADPNPALMSGFDWQCSPARFERSGDLDG